MLKIIRKHNKWIMVVGGSLLMVTFLFTGTSQQFQPDPMKRVVARLGDTPIRLRDAAHADRELEAVNTLLFGLVKEQYGIVDGTHWLLITSEAQRAGLVGEAREGADFLPEVAGEVAELLTIGELRRGGIQVTQDLLPFVRQMAAQRIPEVTTQLEQRIPQAAGQGQIAPQEVLVALAKLRGALRLVQMHQSAGRLSEPRTVMVLRDLMDRAIADVAVIPAAALVNQAPAPDEAALQSLFTRYRESAPGTGGELGFGYKLPPRVKLEWMVFDRAAIEGAITIDPVDVNKHWAQNRTQFPGEFAAEREKVLAQLKSERLTRVMEEIDRIVKSRVRAATRLLPTDGSYRTLPADWSQKRPTLADLALQVVEGVSNAERVTLPLPRIEVQSERFLAVSETGTLPGIGTAVERVGTRVLDLPGLLSMVRELGPREDMDFQAGIPHTNAMVDEAGNLYYLTVLEAQPAAAPATLDEVRAQVERDARLAWAFEKLRAEANDYASRAAAGSLTGVTSSFDVSALADADKPRVDAGMIFQVERGDQRLGTLDTAQIRDRVVQIARTLEPGQVMTADSAPARTFAVAVPAARALAVVQVTGVVPVTLEAQRAVNINGAQSLARLDLTRAQGEQVDAPFTTEALKKRLRYVSTEKSEAAPAAPTPTPTPAQGSSQPKG